MFLRFRAIRQLALNTRKHDTAEQHHPYGTALRDRNLNWSLQQSHSTQDGDSGGVNASYKGTRANLNAGYNQSPDSQQVSYGISGGILAHQNGITLSQPGLPARSDFTSACSALG